MSRQLSSPIFRVDISSTLPESARDILDQLPTLGITQEVELKIIDLYFLEGTLTPGALQEISETLISDPVTDQCQWRKLDQDRVAQFNPKLATSDQPTQSCIEVTLRPGVTDNAANELLQAAHRLGFSELTAVSTGTRYEFIGTLTEAELYLIAKSLLVNDTIQCYETDEIWPEFIHLSHQIAEPEIISLSELDDEGLLNLSAERRLALDLNEMRSIQAHFQQVGRSPTDAELETLAQTWSEHCVHKTFKANITTNGQPDTIDSIIKSYLQAATEQIAAPWVRSAFVDNAGIIAFDDEFDLSFKVETHNHPSAIEPFGGANTGTGGVVRDVLGVSHRPIAATDVLCFGPADTQPEELPSGVLHPLRIRSGVVSGIEDYGNKLGLPTVNGAVIYHPGYMANPLVYCGCVGIGPIDSHPSQPQPGDRVIVIGGRTGRDGLRGATFSSLTMDAQTGQVAGASVQIGDPITEKGTIEVVVRARDQQLYNAITDCGAGGLSSAVGEMAESIGARVDLAQVPLKYAGLAPWEIWLSEAQERMVLAVPPENLPALAEICETCWVEWSDIGEFQPTGQLQVFYDEIPVVDLENNFLHHCPRLYLQADLFQQQSSQNQIQKNNPQSPTTPPNLLLELLAHPNIATNEAIIRVYDHEVRGGTVVKPLVGQKADGPSDAAVLKPLETKGWRGFVLANGVNPTIGEADPYAMAVSAVDEAIRNAVAVGADPDRIAILDNFCWGDPRRPEILGTLVRAAQGCYDAALHYRTPFISGKDSLNNEYVGTDGERHAIPGTLLISSIAIHRDVRKSVTMDLKAPGDRLYLLGDWTPSLAGSHARGLVGEAFFGESPALKQSPGLPARAPVVYRILHEAIHNDLVSAVHDLSEGGLSVAAAEMALAGRLGLSIDLAPMHPDPKLALFAETNGCLLVSVSPEKTKAFEDCFTDFPLLRLGEVTKDQRLNIHQNGEAVIDLPIDACVSAYKTETS